MMELFGMTSDISALLVAIENAEAVARRKGETWSKLTNTERARFILPELNKVGYFIVDRQAATDADRMRNARIADMPTVRVLPALARRS